MAIQTSMSGAEIDRVLSAFLDVMKDSDVSEKILVIRDGKLTSEDGFAFFSVTDLEEI